jgi:hypothetical protein
MFEMRCGIVELNEACVSIPMEDIGDNIGHDPWVLYQPR